MAHWQSRRLALAAALLSAWLLPWGQPVQGQQQELRGVWLTANDMPVLRDRERMQATVDQLAELQFNRLYVVVWNGGMAYYPSQLSESRGFQSFTYRGLQGQDVIGELIQAGRRRGLVVLPWFEFGLMAPPDSEIAKQHRNWLTQKRDGGLTSISAAGEVVWLNPFRPEVQQLITDLVLEAVNQYGAEGIQFDDHMSLPREFGYDPFTVELYRKDTGKAPPANPDDPAWVKWRADRLTAFMQRLSQAIRAARPGAIDSISPNYYAFAYKLQLQDWRRWVQTGIADELLIQIYRPDLASYLPQLSRPEVIEARDRIPTAIAVLSGQRNRPTALSLIQEKVEANREQGLGTGLFYLESLWSLGPEPASERITALKQLLAPQSNPAAITPPLTPSAAPPPPPPPPPLSVAPALP
ncbi:MAG: family 10 glycosylhydrolase [Vulcanococcus sp.]|uniref:family 10 glycosylhydrolase n=1 Tax=Vulcanococcus sp. TaxID=2856995 RepID=UPI0025DEEEF5|nr:family 10 glycosylhydrolase [Vulcanococcus sp.]MBW0166010.1 family 10 glycosylhydrolase [Vulcanococcus sp.]